MYKNYKLRLVELMFMVYSIYSNKYTYKKLSSFKYLANGKEEKLNYEVVLRW